MQICRPPPAHLGDLCKQLSARRELCDADRQKVATMTRAANAGKQQIDVRLRDCESILRALGDDEE